MKMARDLIKEVEKLYYMYLSSENKVVDRQLCLFVLRFHVPVNTFFSHVGMEPPLSGYYQYFWGVKCLAQVHNTAEVGFETPTSRSDVWRSTTEQPHSP